MKLAIVTLVLLPQVVQAYHSGTHKNYPQKETSVGIDSRLPAAINYNQKNKKK